MLHNPLCIAACWTQRAIDYECMKRATGKAWLWTGGACVLFGEVLIGVICTPLRRGGGMAVSVVAVAVGLEASAGH